MEWIDYRQLPPAAGGFSQLFFDYINDFQEVSQFYPSNFRDNEAFKSVMNAVSLRNTDRSTVIRVLHGQNKTFGSSQKTFDNISLLSKPTTYAVVTGQQVALFGGPMYTVLKTITVINLVERLKKKYPTADFVPVFWIEGEDHDFEEMNNTSVFDGQNVPTTITYLPGGEKPERNLGAIGELEFNDSLIQTIQELENALQKTEFTEELLRKLRESYSPGKTFNQSFAGWMNFLFEDYGLIFISSNNKELKQLLAPIFLKEISEYPTFSQMVIARSAELERSYHAQIKPKSLNLFMFHKGGRYLISPRENDFSLKGTRHFLPLDELQKIAGETPEILSPNVVLRPLAQDTLLPTVAYVAGPSEIAYHAQLQPLYEHLDIPQPIIYPRASCSLVDERLGRAMEKYQLDMLEFMEDVNRVTTKVSEQISGVKLDEVFSSASRNLSEALSEMKFGLNEIDPTLLGALESFRSKIDGNLEVLKQKSIAAQKRRNETAVRQIEKAASGLLPNGSLQEREINIIYFMNKYGPDLVRTLVSSLEVTGFKHQIITL